MKVVCIDNIGWKNLTIGKIYEVFKIYNNIWYEIINDDHYKSPYEKQLFKTLSEIRNGEIDKLLRE
jgi:hypothetical protein